MAVCRFACGCLPVVALKRARHGVLGVLVMAMLSGGCSSALNWTPDYHTVRSGETLYSIALRYDLDHRQLARWNQLGDGTFIRQGQRLRLTQPAGAAARGAGTVSRSAVPAAVTQAPPFAWPTRGSVREGFGTSARTSRGIRIGGRRGQVVVAAAGGEVVYAGGGLPSYGQLLIIKHDSTWLSAYGFNARLLVREGDRVASGQQVAEMGQLPSGEPTLHFEIRRNGQPVNPLSQLPTRQ